MLSDTEILQEMKNGRIIIDPFVEENLGPNGYDVTLDPRHWVMKDEPHRINLDNHSITKLFPLDRDSTYESIYDYKEFSSIVDDKKFVILEPHSFILANTREVVGCPIIDKCKEGLVGFFRTRSSLARLGLTFDLTGMGDAGFTSKWTLEVVNNTLNYIDIPEEYRIGQIVFFKVGEVRSWYKGRYSTQHKEWEPIMMIPRMFTGVK